MYIAYVCIIEVIVHTGSNMQSNTTLTPDTPMSIFRKYIRAHQHYDYYSTLFSETIHATAAYRTGNYKSQQDHLEAVTDAQYDTRLASDLYYREMNPAQLLRIIENAGTPPRTVKKAFERGKSSFTSAIASGLSVSSACAKASAAIRAVTWVYLNSSSASDVASCESRPEASI